MEFSSVHTGCVHTYYRAGAVRSFGTVRESKVRAVISVSHADHLEIHFYQEKSNADNALPSLMIIYEPHPVIQKVVAKRNFSTIRCGSILV